MASVSYVTQGRHKETDGESSRQVGNNAVLGGSVMCFRREAVFGILSLG